MKGRATGGLLAISLLAYLAVPAAHANVWDDLAQSYSQDINNSLNIDSRNQAQAEKQYEKFAKAADKVQVQQAQDSEKLAKEQASYDALQRQEQKIETQLNTLKNTPVLKKRFLFFKYSDKGALKDQIADKSQQLAQVQQEMLYQDARRNQAQADLEDINARVKAEQNSADAFRKNVLAPKTATLYMATSQAALAGAAQRTVLGLLDQQRKNGYDSQLLLTNLKVLQQAGKLNALQAQSLRQNWDTQLNNTLMGEYVNSQIQKAVGSICDQDFQSACAAKNTGALEKLINSKLSAPRSWESESSSSDQVKQVPATGAGEKADAVKAKADAAD